MEKQLRRREGIQETTSVREIGMIRVGGARCVPSSTANMMNIQARITWTVEVIRTCIFFLLVDVSIQGRVGSRLTFFFDVSIFSGLGGPRTAAAAMEGRRDRHETPHDVGVHHLQRARRTFVHHQRSGKAAGEKLGQNGRRRYVKSVSLYMLVVLVV